MSSIDVNSDLGESVADIPVGDDEAILDVVSSANVACGFHAGSPHGISATVSQAAARGVTIGAHPAYNDPSGFGRRFIDYDPKQLADEVLYQIGALDAIARSHGSEVRYVKPHGALYNALVRNAEHAQAVIDGLRAFSRSVPLLLLPGSIAAEMAVKAGLQVITEAFADRNYNPDGTLVSRSEDDAVVTDIDAVRSRVIEMATSGTVTARDGSTLRVDAQSICVHGDSPGAVEMAKAIREALDEAGVTVTSFA